MLNTIEEQIKNQILDSSKTLASIDAAQVNSCAEMLAQCLQSSGKILLCGNGGSAADCQHFAAELVVRFRASVKRPALPAIALTCDTSIITACGNDLGFDNIFAQQVSGLGNTGDILIGISTSGNSPNIINAIQVAKARQLKTIGLLGNDGGKIQAMCDASIVIASNTTARIQEAHLLIEHLWCDAIERYIFSEQF